MRLLDESNFQAYRSERAFHYFGGKALRTPLFLAPPHRGKWHLAIDSGTGKYSVKVIDPTVLEFGRHEGESIEAPLVSVLLRLPPDTLHRVTLMAARHKSTPAKLIETLLAIVTRGEGDERVSAGRAPAASPGGDAAQMARQR